MHAAALLALALLSLAACRGPGEPRRTIAGADPERGRVLIRAYGCGACHTIPGVPGARAVVGPPLRGVADRAYIGGVLPNTEADMIRWLRDPPAADPRTVMPNMRISDRDARDIAAYLSRLRAEPLGLRMARGFLERSPDRRAPAPAPPPARDRPK